MSYQALYRVWRPQKFADMVGQEVIMTTLKNAITTGQISHAYLFAGPRGTGKTSAAKIFAKAINCHHQVDGEPCNQCETCKAITAGTLNDVIEIDAASNNGVEEIRDIRDKVKYAPTEADYKVYIIDEVHMLSTGAFNALLKTLEEPPANVIFILATTKPQKIPATIISRTQRFDFKRISASESYDRMVFILKSKEIPYDEKAVKVIAKAAEGGMRDALSILDQVLSFGDNEITLDNALLVTGSVTKELLADYVHQVVAGDATAALASLQQVIAEGKDARRFIEDVISYDRDLLLYRQAPDMVEEAELGILDENFTDFANQINETVLYDMINALNDMEQQMRFTTHPDVYLAVLTIKLTQLGKNGGATPVAATPTTTADPDHSEVVALQQEVATLKDTVTKLMQNGPAPVAKPAAPVQSKPASSNSGKAPKVKLDLIYPVLGAATRQDLSTLQGAWTELLSMLSVTQRAVMNVSTPVAASADGAIIAFDYSFLFQRATSDDELMEALENGLSRLIGKTPSLVFVPKEQWPTIRQDYLAQAKGGTVTPPPVADDEENDDPTPEDNQVVTKAEELFGPDVVDVKQD